MTLAKRAPVAPMAWAARVQTMITFATPTESAVRIALFRIFGLCRRFPVYYLSLDFVISD